MRTIQEQWTIFRQAAIRSNASPAQIHAMKNAFYAGATGYQSIMFSTADDSISEDAAKAIVIGMVEELQAFRESLKAGKKPDAEVTND